MRLSRKSQFAITAMITLAIHDSEKPVILVDIAKSQEISISYVEQLFSSLRYAGLVEGFRGPGGGYRLAKTTDQISIAQIITAIESNHGFDHTNHMGPLTQQRDIASVIWGDFSKQMNEYLSGISLSDVSDHELVRKSHYKLDKTNQLIASMFPVTNTANVA